MMIYRIVLTQQDMKVVAIAAVVVVVVLGDQMSKNNHSGICKHQQALIITLTIPICYVMLIMILYIEKCLQTKIPGP